MKATRIQRSASINKIIFIALSEIMANSYMNTKVLVGFDNTTLNKLRNLKPSLERSLKEDVLFLETGGEGLIQLYHELTQIFEDILVTAQKGDALYFERLMKLIKAYHTEDLQFYDSIEEIQQLTENK